MIGIINRLILQYACVRRSIIAYLAMRNLSQQGSTLIDIEVSARIGEVYGEIHIRYRCPASYGLTLGESSTMDSTCYIFHRENLISRDIGRTGGDCLETDIIERKVVSDIFVTGVLIDHT